MSKPKHIFRSGKMFNEIKKKNKTKTKEVYQKVMGDEAGK